MLHDAFPIVLEAIQRKRTAGLARAWRVDKKMRFAVADMPFTVRGYDQLAAIVERSRKHDTEVAFGSLIDVATQEVHTFTEGALGTHDECDWGAGDLLDRLRSKASSEGLSYMLNHTHPPKYGPGCSLSYWKKRSLAKFASNPVYAAMLKDGLYQKFGTDFLEMRVRQHLDAQLSSYFMIVTPSMNSVGLFHIAPGTSMRSSDPVARYHRIVFAD